MKRYNWYDIPDTEPYTKEEENGAWCLWEDVEPILQELESCKRVIQEYQLRYPAKDALRELMIRLGYDFDHPIKELYK
jgi:hypothetical protein